jgi:hypothetical protein
MNKEYLVRFLEQVSYISSITFTGGEPTLPSGQKVIRDFMDVCNHLGVCVGSFYMVTNAKVWRPELPALINDLYCFCDDNEISMIEISTDQFHDRIQLQRSTFKFRLEEDLLYKYRIENMIHMREEIPYHRLVDQGRAVNIGSGSCYEPSELWIEFYGEDINITDGDIYLNCDGNVILGCDWSYESQKDHNNIICSVYDDFEKAIREKTNNFTDAQAA